MIDPSRHLYLDLLPLDTFIPRVELSVLCPTVVEDLPFSNLASGWLFPGEHPCPPLCGSHLDSLDTDLSLDIELSFPFLVALFILLVRPMPFYVRGGDVPPGSLHCAWPSYYPVGIPQ